MLRRTKIMYHAFSSIFAGGHFSYFIFYSSHVNFIGKRLFKGHEWIEMAKRVILWKRHELSSISTGGSHTFRGEGRGSALSVIQMTYFFEMGILLYSILCLDMSVAEISSHFIYRIFTCDHKYKHYVGIRLPQKSFYKLLQTSIKENCVMV